MVFSADSRADVLGSPGRFFLRTFPNPVQQRTCAIFSKDPPRSSCTNSPLLVWIYCFFLVLQVWPGNPKPPRPPSPPDSWSGWEACHFANANPSVSASTSSYKVQQNNSKLLCVAEQRSLLFEVRLHFQSMRKEEKREKSQNPEDFVAQLLSVATPAEPRGEKILYFFCKFWEVKNFSN